MRILFSCVAAYGHFHPLVPLARAFEEEGHDVAFATAEGFGDRVRSAGFKLLPAGLAQDELEVPFAPYRRQLAELPIDSRRPFAYRWRFARLDAPAKVQELKRHAESWSPDLIVHDSSDLAGPLVAAALDLPSMHHSFGRMVPLPCLEGAAEEIEPLWRDAGLEPDPYCGVFRGAYLDICPPSFQSERVPEGTAVVRLRPLFPAMPGERAPAWLGELPERPTVYVTLGTVRNDLGIFRLLLDALADLDCNVIATIGLDNDPASLDPVPANARVERYVSQSFVLPKASVVVGHGGSGSTLATLAHRLPSLLVPQGADQFENARQCVALGTGRALLPGDVTVEAVRDAVADLLGDTTYALNAGRIADEIAAMPTPDDTARTIAGTMA